jgi:hypothetical protein
LKDYIAVWGDETSLIEGTFHPDVVLYVDRFPSASGKGSSVTNVTNKRDFTALLSDLRMGRNSIILSLSDQSRQST